MKNRFRLRAEMPLWLQLGKVARRYQDSLSDRLKHIGIERHYYLLLAIEEGEGKMTQQELADVLETDKVTMVGIMNYLSEKGFVDRKPDKEDGRKHRIALTSRARAALPEIRKTISDLNKQALSGLPSSLADHFHDVLKLIRTELEKSPEPEAKQPSRPSRHLPRPRTRNRPGGNSPTASGKPPA